MLHIVQGLHIVIPARAEGIRTDRHAAHSRDILGDLGAQQVTAHAGFGALADLNLDRIAAVQVIGRYAPAPGRPLDDQVAARVPISCASVL